MSGKYRKFTLEYRDEAVKMVLESGWPVADTEYIEVLLQNARQMIEQWQQSTAEAA